MTARRHDRRAPDAREPQRITRTVFEIQCLLFVWVLLYRLVDGNSDHARTAIDIALVPYGALILVFRQLRLRQRDTRWHGVLEAWVMIAFVTLVLWFTGGLRSPLLNLYLLPVVAGALTLGERAALLVVGLIAACFMLLGQGAVEPLVAASTATGPLAQLIPMLLVAYITTKFSADIRFGIREAKLLSETDELTDLHNMRGLSRVMADAFGHAGRRVGIIFLDLDHFKYVNDGYGHPAGDALLKAVAARLRAGVRSSDAVARIGGDEFAIVLADLKDPLAGTAAVARTLLESFAQPFRIDGHEFRITASMGVSVYPADGRDLDELLKNADIAMYRAKENGRNNCQYYAGEMSTRAVERARLEVAMRQALVLGQFDLHYQPLVAMATGRVVGIEALLRWRHPVLGDVEPATFIPLAEEIGLINPIGEWVLRRACAQNRSWQVAGMPPLNVSVNLSAVQLRQPGFVDLVAQVLAESGLEARHLDLELTESAVMGGSDAVVACLHRMRALGVTLSMDDFGTGYSNLGYLTRLPLDVLKMDRTFVRDIPTDARAGNVARAIVSMGQSVGMRVVAEGVETSEQADFLESAGCEYAQGFLYCRPLAADALEAWVRARGTPHRPAQATAGKERNFADVSALQAAAPGRLAL